MRYEILVTNMIILCFFSCNLWIPCKSDGVEVLAPFVSPILTGQFDFSSDFANISGELQVAEPITACKFPLGNVEQLRDKIVLVNGIHI